MTKHAVRRIKERGGIPKRAAEDQIAKSVANGMPMSATGGRLRRFLDHQSCMHKRNLVLGDNDLLYAVANDEAVVTVLTIPHEHRKQARTQLAKWKAAAAV